MPSQFITFPHSLFASLYDHDAGLTSRLAAMEFYAEAYEAPDGRRSILVSGYREPHGIGPRSVTQECQLAVVLLPEGAGPTHWPRPLPDDVTARLLHEIEQAALSLENLTGHDLLSVIDAIDHARRAPAITERPVDSLPPRTGRQRRLRRIGLKLSRTLNDQLATIDHMRESYEARLIASDLEGVVVKLSCHAALGLGHHLGFAGPDCESSVDLAGEGPRRLLLGSILSAAALADATTFGLVRYDSYGTALDEQMSIGALAVLNSIICSLPSSECGQDQFRTGDAPSRGTGELRIVPARGIPGSLKQWLSDFSPGYWVGIHPVIQGAIGVAEFLRVSPDKRGNGRLARLLFGIALRRRGWRALPWEAVFEALHSECRSAVRAAIKTGEYCALASLFLRAYSHAVRLGDRMIDVLGPERRRLSASVMRPDMSPKIAWRRAEELVSGVVVRGFSSTSLEGDRSYLVRMAERGLIDRVQTPIGTVFSIPAVRALLARPLG